MKKKINEMKLKFEEWQTKISNEIWKINGQFLKVG